MTSDKNNPWYIGGLHFECLQCGNCCSGPGEGYIWICKKEIEILSDNLKLTPEKLHKKYLKRFGTRTSIKEEARTKDCLFLCKSKGSKSCGIYHYRPNQCRTWPFWTSNLTSPYDWNAAAVKCPGINRGRLYTFEQIEAIRTQKKWWHDEEQ